LDDLGAGCAAKEESGFRVLGGLGSFFVLGAFTARVARFAGEIRIGIELSRSMGNLHLSQHPDVVVELRSFAIKNFFCCLKIANR
jgi:hypothetical protein